MFMFAFIDMFIDSIDYALQGETMGMHRVRIVSLSPKAVSKQDGIVEVPEETDCSGRTSVNKKTVPSEDFVPVTRPQSHREDKK
ncbi:hypothetical protein T07_7923 [Trichinella nelsoni]|uniref:Uncharacterized protein n=1 Tax=Trichinella nelsoni TaxID=6336 RepID=A0A0V0RH38_9BILA|nr:hypothetical protein T07_7923 [Trichinella nelsoni]